MGSTLAKQTQGMGHQVEGMGLVAPKGARRPLWLILAPIRGSGGSSKRLSRVTQVSLSMWTHSKQILRRSQLPWERHCQLSSLSFRERLGIKIEVIHKCQISQKMSSKQKLDVALRPHVDRRAMRRMKFSKLTTGQLRFCDSFSTNQ
jgi:hypothetical protein